MRADPDRWGGSDRLEIGMQLVQMIQMVVMVTQSNRGRKSEILEKQQHILVTAIIHDGRVVYYKNSTLLRSLLSSTIFTLRELAGL